MFVHTGTFQLLVNCAALVQLGLILERLVGHVTFAAVYVAAGVLASIVSLSDYPMAISSGASGAIFGLYGLLLASSAWTRRPSRPAAARVEPQPAAGMTTFGFRELSQADIRDAERGTRSEPTPDARAGATGVVITMTAARRLAPDRGDLSSLQPRVAAPSEAAPKSPGSPPASSAASR